MLPTLFQNLYCLHENFNLDSTMCFVLLPYLIDEILMMQLFFGKKVLERFKADDASFQILPNLLQNLY